MDKILIRELVDIICYYLDIESIVNFHLTYNYPLSSNWLFKCKEIMIFKICTGSCQLRLSNTVKCNVCNKYVCSVCSKGCRFCNKVSCESCFRQCEYFRFDMVTFVEYRCAYSACKKCVVICSPKSDKGCGRRVCPSHNGFRYCNMCTPLK